MDMGTFAAVFAIFVISAAIGAGIAALFFERFGERLGTR